MKQVPTTWDDVRFIDGYPGKYVILARRHGDKWYVAGVNAQQETLKTEITLPMWASGTELQVYADDKELQGEVKSVKLGKKQTMKVTIPCNGGLIVNEILDVILDQLCKNIDIVIQHLDILTVPASGIDAVHNIIHSFFDNPELILNSILILFLILMHLIHLKLFFYLIHQ